MASLHILKGPNKGENLTLAQEKTTLGRNPDCTVVPDGPQPVPDAIGYHTAREIPNYWTYARDFVLQDHLFEQVASWSLPQHLYMVSGWSARCSAGSSATAASIILSSITVCSRSSLPWSRC